MKTRSIPLKASTQRRRRAAAAALALAVLLGGCGASSPAVPRFHVSTAHMRVVWRDEFNGPAGSGPDPARWVFDVGGNGWGNNELESYTSRPANVELDGRGHLVITARAERFTGEDGITRSYTSARIETDQHFSFRYGLMEARIRVPSGRGLLPAFWALEQTPHVTPAGPQPGEIDAMEVVGSRPNVVNGTVHGPWRWAPGGLSSTTRTDKPLSSGFHVYGVWWTPRLIGFTLDGRPYGAADPRELDRGSVWPFRDRYILLLDVAVGGTWPGSPSPMTRFPASMVVDWVRVWQ